MQHLSIDSETYSSVNLQKAGVYKYAESPDFDILLYSLFLFVFCNKSFCLLDHKAEKFAHCPYDTIDGKTVDQAEKDYHIDVFHKFV